QIWAGPPPGAGGPPPQGLRAPPQTLRAPPRRTRGRAPRRPRPFGGKAAGGPPAALRPDVRGRGRLRRPRSARTPPERRPPANPRCDPRLPRPLARTVQEPGLFRRAARPTGAGGGGGGGGPRRGGPPPPRARPPPPHSPPVGAA